MNTQLSNLVTLDALQAVAGRHNYPLAPGLNFMTPFGVRSKNPASNTFDDIIGAVFLNDNNVWDMVKFAGTTDPGSYWLEHPMNVDGTHIMVPGFHKDAYATGRHHGLYLALVQVAPISFYRDNTKDDNLDFDPSTIETKLIGANIHHASPDHTSTQVDKWSAACQVLADPKDFAVFMAQVQKHLAVYPDLFSYMLLEEKDFTSL